MKQKQILEKRASFIAPVVAIMVSEFIAASDLGKENINFWGNKKESDSTVLEFRGEL